MIRRPPRSTLFPTRRSSDLLLVGAHDGLEVGRRAAQIPIEVVGARDDEDAREDAVLAETDRKSTRLNSSHGYISYAVFCLKKKKKRKHTSKSTVNTTPQRFT